MKTKLHYVFTITIFLMVFSAFAQDNFFIRVGKEQKSSGLKNTTKTVSVYEFNYEILNTALSKANITTSKASEIVFSFPNYNGDLERYRVKESSVLHPDMQAKYPEIRSYIARGIDTPSALLRFCLSPYKGLSGIVLSKNTPEVIEPISTNKNQFKVIQKSSLDKVDAFNCKTIDALSSFLSSKSSSNLKDADDSIKRVYTLALSVTGEYSSFHGNTLPTVNAALVATLTNINAVFENDFNVALELASNNDNVIYTNPATDPYTNLSSYGSQLQTTLDTEIGDANYDVGHLLAASGFDGNAGCIGCVCDSGIKGRGYTSSSNPDGFNFDIDLVAHEIGHQFGANHTWTHDGNEGANVQMEPGSGSTIMGYAGITGSTNVQVNSDPYFHAISIEQVTTFIKTTSCATETNTGNTTPTVNAGLDITLPVGTPFKLVGTATDADGDNLTYCWEQINEDNAITTFPNPNSGNSNTVLFRSFLPTTSSTRYFPNLSDLKYGLNSGQWEKVPNVSRTADFRLTVRDNKTDGANNSHQDVRVTFDANAGPLTVTSQSTSGLFWTSGSTEVITWNVNNTNTIPGASNVNILLSIDGGLTYNQVANNVPNNGNYNLTVPNTPATHCRVMVEAANNTFFAINAEDFAIDFNVTNTCTQYASSNNLNINIADNSGTLTANNVINIADGATITDLNVGLNITHSFIGDLGISLESPNDTEIVLKTLNDCNSEENIIGIFDDDAIQFNCMNASSNVSQKSVNDLLSILNGEDQSGNWTIKVGDFQPGDSGTLNSWFIEVCQTEHTPLDLIEFLFENVKLYPNPSNGEFSLKIDTPHVTKRISLELFDIRGRLVYTQNFAETTMLEENVTLKNTQSGMYILRLTDGSKTDVRKIVIE